MAHLKAVFIFHSFLSLTSLCSFHSFKLLPESSNNKVLVVLYSHCVSVKEPLWVVFELVEGINPSREEEMCTERQEEIKE